MNLLKDNKINPDQYSAEGKPAIEIVLQGPLPSDVKLEFMNYCGTSIIIIIINYYSFLTNYFDPHARLRDVSGVPLVAR
jgi:hypothetical protein